MAPRIHINSADHEQPFRTIAGIGPSLVVSRGDADRRIVEPPHQNELFDAAGRQPIAGTRQRRDRDGEAAVAVAHDFLAGEAVAVDRVRHQPAFRIVQRHRPVARRRRHAADREGAAAVEIIAGIVGMGIERHAVARAGRQFAGARDDGARIGIDIDRSAFRPCRPGADGQRAEGDAARQREPGRAEPDRGRDQQRETRTEQQPHARSRSKLCREAVTAEIQSPRGAAGTRSAAVAKVLVPSVAAILGAVELRRATPPANACAASA